MSYNLYVACIHWFVVSLSVSLLAANFISSVSTMFSLHLHVFPLWAVRLLANFSEFVLLDLIQKSFYIALVGKFFIVLCQILINRPCNGGFTSLTFLQTYRVSKTIHTIQVFYYSETCKVQLIICTYFEYAFRQRCACTSIPVTWMCFHWCAVVTLFRVLKGQKQQKCTSEILDSRKTKR